MLMKIINKEEEQLSLEIKNKKIIIYNKII